MTSISIIEFHPSLQSAVSASVGDNDYDDNNNITLELSQIWWLNSPGLVPVGTRAATLDVNWSNVLNWVSLSKESIFRSSKDNAFTPHSPSMRRFHVVPTPQPRGVTIPNPKTSPMKRNLSAELKNKEHEIKVVSYR